MKLFCFGLGFTAQTLINRLTSARGPSDDEWQFSGTHTSSGEFIFNGTSPLKAFQKHSKDITHLLISIPPSGSQDLVLKYHYDHIVQLAHVVLIVLTIFHNHDVNHFHYHL